MNAATDPPGDEPDHVGQRHTHAQFIEKGWIERHRIETDTPHHGL